MKPDSADWSDSVSTRKVDKLIREWQEEEKEYHTETEQQLIDQAIEGLEWLKKETIDNVLTLKEIRERKGLSAWKVAEVMKITWGELMNAEGLRNYPSLEVAEKIAKGYGITLDYLWLSLEKGRRELEEKKKTVEKQAVH